MKKLNFLLGEWRGEGWIQVGAGERRTFTQNENVQSKLLGTLTQIEGTGRGKIAGKGEEVVIHNAFAVISFDAKAGRYNFHAYQAQGQVIDAEPVITENALVWGFQIPQGAVRFTIKINDKGQWFEIGEFAQDGKTWQQFFEMTLNRLK